MKNLFPHFYKESKASKEDAIRSGLIFLDTNVLLHFFRLDESFVQTFFQILNKLQDRVFIPYQVAKEYHPKYLELCISLRKSYENAIKKLTDLKDPIQQLESLKEDYVRFLNKDFKKDISKDFKILISQLEEKYHKEIDSLQKELENEELFMRIGDFFSNRVLKKLSNEEMEDVIKRGKERYDKKIPPGYMDGKKDDNQFGDFIIWEEMIKTVSAKSEIKYAIFVSDDVKEDWIIQICGEKHGPRNELIDEFYNRTNARFYKMTVASFINAVQNLYNVVDKSDAEKAQEASTTFQNQQKSKNFDKISRKMEKLPYKEEIESDIEIHEENNIDEID